MRLVIIPDVDGDSFAIVSDSSLPENFITVTEYNLKNHYSFDKLIQMLEDFNETV
jgi:hypothetical protein